MEGFFLKKAFIVKIREITIIKGSKIIKGTVATFRPDGTDFFFRIVEEE